MPVISCIRLQEQPISADLCASECLTICQAKRADVLMREQALRTLGMIAIARPVIALSDSVRGVVADSLSLAAELPMKRVALHNILDLLKSEERELVSHQRVKESTQAKSSRKGKHKPEHVAAVNGEGDALSTSSTVLQACRCSIDPPHACPSRLEHGLVAQDLVMIVGCGPAGEQGAYLEAGNRDVPCVNSACESQRSSKRRTAPCVLAAH